MSKEISIKTSLFYLFGNQKDELKELIMDYFEDEESQFKNLSDLLLYAVALKTDPVNLETGYLETLPQKHSKTFLLYFSEEEHKVVNDYINSFIPKEYGSVMKKQSRTEIVISLISEVILL